MKKLALDLDALRVDTFATQLEADVHGTVHAHDDDTLPTEFCTQEKGCTRTTCPTAYGQDTCAPYC